MEGAIYLLCAVTALACCWLLLRGYRRSRVPLLLWCGLCFLALTLENTFLFVDLVMYKEIDLAFLHIGSALIGVALLTFGLIWETK